LTIQIQQTKKRACNRDVSPLTLERELRQLLANRISGTMVGMWLLIPEHLRLGTWDLLCGWTGKDASAVEPRLALQTVQEAALCTDVRHNRCLSQMGFEVANGLPFVATDQAIHQLFQARTIEQTQALQVALGRIRRVLGHYHGQLLAIDPHHMRSHTQRQMRQHRHKESEKAVKTLQTFFCLDVQTKQPVAFILGSAAKTVSQATPELLGLVQDILNPAKGQCLIVADCEHYTGQIFNDVCARTNFDLLVPMRTCAAQTKAMAALDPKCFIRHWAGFATAQVPFQFAGEQSIYTQLIQRRGENPDDLHFKAFLTNSTREALQALTNDYPGRWHVEEFFNLEQAMGWKRAGTLNLNVRYAKGTMALLAQAAMHQLRQRWGEPFAQWEASHFAKQILHGIDGDVRVYDDTIVVTLYNAPYAERFRQHYEHLPKILEQQKINPRIPWLFDFKLDFCFK
jgi:hypothetical protein